MKGALPQWLVRAGQRLRYRRHRARHDAELEEELAFHLEQTRLEHLRAGASSDAARALSLRRMGNMTSAREECRDMWSFLAVEQLGQDLRHAVRMYGRTPGFTAISVLSLALGIGGNAAMLSLVNALLVKPLPYGQPERLTRITGIFPRAAVPFFQERSRTMDVAAVSVGSEFNLMGSGPASRVTGSWASPNFLTVLGAPVALGRGFAAGEDKPGRDGVVLLSDRLWRRRFGADPRVIGRVIRVDDRERTVVGVLPAGFQYPSARVELWMPMRMDASNFLEYWGTEFMPLIGRLRAGATEESARAEVRGLVAQFRGTFPYVMARDWNADSTVIPLQRDLVGDVRGRLLILLGCVGLVLLIACANVAGLLLSRATTRRKEMALRAALGAGRMRVVRQLLAESAGLALVGAAVGLAAGSAALGLFRAMLPATLPGVAEAGIDWTVIGAVTALAVAAGIGAGLAPAWSASRVELMEAMRSGSARSTTGGWTRLRSWIVGAEVALTLVLLVSAGLLLRSLWTLTGTDAGFEGRGVLTVQMSPGPAVCAERAACLSFYDRLARRATEIDGVTAAAVANSVPLDGQVPTLPGDIEGYPKTAERPAPLLWFAAVTPEYFRMLRIPLVAGRLPAESDGAGSEPVVVISSALARRYWPDGSAVGRHIRRAGERDWRTVVGVVGDVHQFSLSQAVPANVAGTLYVPYAQAAREDGRIPVAMTLLVKAGRDGAAVRAELQALAAAQDPNVPVGPVTALAETAENSIADFRAMMRLLLSFAGAAVVLAAVGLYGLMSYWVSQRSYEIGLRVAVGATRGAIVSLIFAQGLRVALWGTLAGLGLALGLTRGLRSLLYGVTATDGWTFAAVTALVLLVAAGATAWPAWRAARLDPVRALRAE